MRAGLPMYDLPALRHATDAWWRGLARHLRAAGIEGVPARLQRDPPPAESDPDLLLSQTCGYPLTHALAGRVSMIGTPCYGAPGSVGPRYLSRLLVRADAPARGLADLRGGTCACNQRDSHSGYNVLRRMVAPLAVDGRFFERVALTGSHEASVAAVAAGRADLCAVDEVLHALLEAHRPQALAGLRVLADSPSAPGLPYVAGPRTAPATLARMRTAIDAAVADPALAPTREALLISGFVVLDERDYAEIPAMEREAAALGYPELR